MKESSISKHKIKRLSSQLVPNTKYRERNYQTFPACFQGCSNLKYVFFTIIMTISFDTSYLHYEDYFFPHWHYLNIIIMTFECLVTSHSPSNQYRPLFTLSALSWAPVCIRLHNIFSMIHFNAYITNDLQNHLALY